MQLCDLFSCTMDTLMREDASELEVEDSQKYDVHMEKRRKHITLGVVLLIMALALYELLDGVGVMEAVADTVFFAVAIAGILVLVVAGIQHKSYRKRHPVIPEFYDTKEKEQFDEKFSIRVAVGVGAILIGFLIGMNGENFPMAVGMTEDFYYGIFMVFVAAGAGVLVHTGIVALICKNY